MKCSWPLIDVPGVLDKLTEEYRWAHFVFYFVVWQSSLSDSRQSKFGWNLAGGSIEISDFGADVNNRAPLNYSVFRRQVQLGQSTISGGITVRLTYVTESGISICCYKTDKWSMNRTYYLLNHRNRIVLRVGYQYLSQYITT